MKQEQEQKSIVSLTSARKVATNFRKLHSTAARKSTNATGKGLSNKEIDEVLVVPDKQGDPALYIVKFVPTGFVIISASRKESPILGFSENTVYDNKDSLSGLSSWINRRRDRIQALKHNTDMEVPEDVEQAWDEVTDIKYMSAPPIDEEEVVPGPAVQEQVGPLLQTAWGQGYPYNQYVPVKISYFENALTGCVATATAQVMRYWSYPNTYNWNIMPSMTRPIEASEPGTQEISRLMVDIGQHVNMVYGPDGSSAATVKAKDALVNFYGYSGTASYVDYSINTVVAQLKARQPVIMDGVDYGAQPIVGHAWVCDGYQRTKYVYIHNPDTRYEYETYRFSNYYLHMNWGWDGISDGWFLYNDFTPGSSDYSQSNKCIVNIHP